MARDTAQLDYLKVRPPSSSEQSLNIKLTVSNQSNQSNQSIQSNQSTSNYTSASTNGTGSCSVTHSSSSEEMVTYLFPDLKALDHICEGLEGHKSKQPYDTVAVQGFEIYIVEQWACERKHGTIITSYTGDSSNVIKAGKVVVPKDTSKWCDKFIEFFNEISDTGAKIKSTEAGLLFVTNLSSFPSKYNLLPIPCGDMKQIWGMFVVNLNLRRMNCGGRSALLLSNPTDACGDKFRQIYKTHPNVDIEYSAKELVTLVQICLVYFKLLDPNYVDGLLCNFTEKKIKEWWASYGETYFGIKPKDGMLGPTTVAAILGLVLSCYFRLDMVGSDFPKEPFNYFNFIIAVGKFQKQYGLERSWYLDEQTVEKLFKVTSTKSSSDISKLKNAVKSTVKDIYGKSSTIELAKDVLTSDLEKSIKYFNCSGRLSYLWYFKGHVEDLKGFDYTSNDLIDKSKLRSQVSDKLKNLRNSNNPSKKPKSKKHNDSETEKSSEISTINSVPYSEPVKDTSRCELLPQTLDDSYACKKKILQTCKDSFNKGLHRRLSFPYIRQEVCITQTGYENHKVSLVSKLDQEQTLKRTKSLSFIERSIYTHEIKPIPAAQFISKQVQKIEMDWVTRLDNLQKFESKKHEYSDIIKKSSNELEKMHQMFRPISKTFEFNTQSSKRLEIKIQDITTIGARLEYEMRTLSTKVRDTRDSVEQFSLRVDALYNSLKDSQPFLYDLLISEKELPTNIEELSSIHQGGGWFSGLFDNLDLDRIVKKWNKLDPSLGYYNWIMGKLFNQQKKNQ